MSEPTSRQTVLAMLTAKANGDIPSLCLLLSEAGDVELITALAMLHESIHATAEARGITARDHLAELGMRQA